MLAAGATPIIGIPDRFDGQPSAEQGTTLDGALTSSDCTSVEVVSKRKTACPAMTVPTQVPWSPFSVEVAEATASPGTKLSPPITVPARAGTTVGLLAVPLSMTATTTPLPRILLILERGGVDQVVVEAVVGRPRADEAGKLRGGEDLLAGGRGKLLHVGGRRQLDREVLGHADGCPSGPGWRAPR